MSPTYTLLPSSAHEILVSMSAHTASLRGAKSSYNGLGPPFPLRKRRGYVLPLTVTCSLVVFLTLAYAMILVFLPDFPVASPFLSDASTVGWDDRPADILDHIPIPFVSSPYLLGPFSPLGHHAIALSDDPTHVLVPSAPLAPPVRLLEPIHDRLPQYLLSQYYALGTLSSSVTPLSVPIQPAIDLVYLFVNASSPYFQEALGERAEQEGIKSIRGKARRWRDNGELRGAIRSGVKSLGDALGRVHVISADFNHSVEEEYDIDLGEELPVKDDDAAFSGGDHLEPMSNSTGEFFDATDIDIEIEEWRIGQIPAWMDWAGTSSRRIAWHFHSWLYRLPRDNDGSLPPALREGEWADEENWRRSALPSFDSFGIETRVGWIEGLSEHFVLSNDDMFILSDMSKTDFHHPLLGSIIRLDPSAQILVRPQISPDLHSTPGEWGGLQHASLLLSNRFPKKSRMYMHHLPKSLSRSIVHEASIMFAEELTVAATRGFRESKRGLADLEMAWLVTHLMIERWREALLWSWVVGRVGGASGIWGEAARDELRTVFGVQAGQEQGSIEVKKGERTTLVNAVGITRQVGWEAPKNSQFQFSSFDGYLPLRPDLSAEGTSCHFSFDECLFPDFFSRPTRQYSAAEVFTRLTFAQSQCGDCLIDALISASGPSGLSAVLPTEDQVFQPLERERRMWERDEPILPMTGHWEDADFSVANVVRPGQDVWAGDEGRGNGTVSLRDWSIKLLSRYAYTVATTPSRFSQIHSMKQLDSTFKSIDTDDSLAMACINDDQPDTAGQAVRERYVQWMEGRWGGRGVWDEWEKEGAAW